MIGKRSSRLGVITLPIHRLHVELTNRCNFSCEFCPDGRMSRPRGSMSFGMVERLLAQAEQEGLAAQIHFHVMGEPLLYPDLTEAVATARRHGMETWVTTNGSLLTPPLLEELRGAGLSHLSISLQTPDASTFELRGSRLFSFEQYRDRLVGTLRAFLAQSASLHLSICFLVNPLRRFLAPGAPTLRVAQSGRELRTHMERWVRLLFADTPSEGQIPRLIARTRKAGILKECRVPLSEALDFRVRILGNWGGHLHGPIAAARFGYCPGLSENFGILWNGDYVFCCADYDGKTVAARFPEMPLRDYLLLPAVQQVAQGFQKYRVVHPHCQQCLGDRRVAMSLFRQVGSILYFKIYRRLLEMNAEEGKAA